MNYDALEQHLVNIGLAPTGTAFQPVPGEVMGQLEARTGGRLPSVLQWLFSRFGGLDFPEGVFYFDPRVKRDVLLGFFFGTSELLAVLEDYRESLPGQRPFRDTRG